MDLVDFLRQVLGRRRFAGAELTSHDIQIVLKRRCDRMRAAEHAPGDPLHVLKRRHGLADIVECRGASVIVVAARPPS